VPVSVTEVFVQVIVPEETAVTVGGVVFAVTVTVAVFVQPFAGLVEVTSISSRRSYSCGIRSIGK